MVFNVNISAALPGAPNINVQVEAADLVAALEAAKPLVLKSARASLESLLATVPADNRPPTTPSA